MNVFKLFQVEKRFGSKIVLKNIEFESKEDEILGIFGRNGCGKSTLLKIIFGTLRFDKFEAFFNGNKYLPEKILKNNKLPTFRSIIFCHSIKKYVLL